MTFILLTPAPQELFLHTVLHPPFPRGDLTGCAFGSKDESRACLHLIEGFQSSFIAGLSVLWEVESGLQGKHL